MKASKEFLAKLEPVFSFKMPSKSEKGKYHEIGWFEKDTKFTLNHWYCDCDGFPTAQKNNHYCRHIRIFLNKMKGLTLEEEKYGTKNHK